MATKRFVGLALGLLLPLFGAAHAAELIIPSLTPLQRDTVESVDITLGPAAMGFISFMSRFAADGDGQSAAARKVLRGVQQVRIHNVKFETDHALAQRQVLQGLRAQLAAPGWRRQVQVRKPGAGENVDVYYVPAGAHTLSELAMLVSQPCQFTLVHITGAIDLDEIATLRQTFASD
jgi:hypothetical protein